jgi:hypothetical protein
MAYQVGLSDEPHVLQVNMADMVTSFYAAKTVCGANETTKVSGSISISST